MPDPAKLLELAARCEAASGADREIDIDIYEAMGRCVHDTVLTRVEVEPGEFDIAPVCRKCGKEGATRIYEIYTRLIDSARKLVPDGCVFSVMTDFELPGRARVWGPVPADNPHHRGWSSDAATPALALCAAGLRALAAKEGE